MPYACYTFDEDIDARARDVAQKLAAASAFMPETTPFHVPVFGSLHRYLEQRDTVFAAFSTAPATPATGRFVSWEIRNEKLLATVELDGAAALLSHLKERLPGGKPWKCHYVTFGSVEGIEAVRHDEFLTAVKQSFPIENSLPFALSRLEFHVAAPAERKHIKLVPSAQTQPHAATNTPMTMKTDPPVAAAPAPTASTSGQKKKKGKARHKPVRAHENKTSPHMKWEPPTGVSSMDELIKAGSTGSTVVAQRAAKQKLSGAASRKSAITKRRERAVWMVPEA